jgi:Flp pilus assembly protein TadB
VTLCLAVVIVAAASILGLTLAVQGWATSASSTTIQTPAAGR